MTAAPARVMSIHLSGDPFDMDGVIIVNGPPRMVPKPCLRLVVPIVYEMHQRRSVQVIKIPRCYFNVQGLRLVSHIKSLRL